MYFCAIIFLGPYLHQFSAMVQKMQFFVLFGTNLHYFFFKFGITTEIIDAGNAPTLNKFYEQHQHQKRTIYNAQIALIGANKVQI